MTRRPASNPLLEPWNAPFGMPPFELIRPEHFLPAFDAAIAARRAEVEAIAANPEPPSFANTVVALENGGVLLDRLSRVFFGLVAAETNDALQAVSREIAPWLAALNDDVLLDPRLFARVEAVWSARAGLGLSPVDERLLSETRREFVRGGARLSAEQQGRLRVINAELAVLAVRFGENLLADTNAFRLVLDRTEQLAGLPQPVIDAAARTAADSGLPGRWVFTLQAPSLWPFLRHAEDRALRRSMLLGWTTRGNHGDAHDNKALIARMVALRAERAGLLGYASHAHYVLDDSMAGRPERVYDLLEKIWSPAREVAAREADALRREIAGRGADHPLEPWDWRHYANGLRAERFDLDEEQVRAYFPLDAVRAGAFEVARRLYGLTFHERHDLPRYHPEIRTFEVRGPEGDVAALFVTDDFPRQGKRAGAWCSCLRESWIESGRKVVPIVVNVANLTRPSEGRPALLGREEIDTLFHEFGHALHAILSRVPYRSLNSVPRDFVELPSQIMEHWAMEPEVLALYARHWQTGEPIPADFVEKLSRAEQFNKGFETVEYLAAAFLDMDWHTVTEPAEHDVDAFEAAALARIGLPPEIPVRYSSPAFNHVFGPGAGYAAAYYSYIWSAVLDTDAYEAFRERGLFDRRTADAFRREILERGNSEAPMTLFVRFRGREPSPEPLLRRRGLTGS